MTKIALLVLLSACQPQQSAIPSSPPPAVYFPQHGLTSQTGVPAGDLVAQLELLDGCLVLQGEGVTYLALWPASYGLGGEDPINVLDEQGVTVARAGQMVHVGGGVYPDAQREFVEELIGADIDGRCVAEGYWLVSEVLP